MTSDPQTIETIAQVVHAAIRAYQIALGEAPSPEWAAAEEWQRASTREAVRYQLANPTALVSAEHDRWMAERLRDGWVWGPVKDPAAKTHPLLIPYEQLPEDQRRKDALVKAIVGALAAASM
jgi:hypothetical protein